MSGKYRDTMPSEQDLDFSGLDDGGADGAPDGMFADDGRGGDDFEADGDDGYNLPPEPKEEDQRNSRVQQPNARGPRPAIPGGARGGDEVENYVRNFWSDKQRREENDQDGQGSGNDDREFFRALTDRLSRENESGSARTQREQLDASWNEYLQHRAFGPSLEDLAKKFTEAGNDGSKNTAILHEHMQSMARSLYRELATDMQASLAKTVRDTVQPMLERELQNVASQQSYDSVRAQFLSANPQYKSLGGLIDTVLQRALTHTKGNGQKAIHVATRVLSDTIRRAGGGGNGNGGRNGAWPGDNGRDNNRSGSSINWQAELGGGRRR